MYTQQGMHSMLHDVELARTWTKQMSNALVRNGQNFGFGGSTTKNWLQVAQGARSRGRSRGRIGLGLR